MKLVKKHKCSIAIAVGLIMIAISTDFLSLDPFRKSYIVFVFISCVAMAFVCENDSADDKINAWLTAKFRTLNRCWKIWLRQKETWRDLREDDNPDRAVRRLTRRRKWWELKQRCAKLTILSAPFVAIVCALLALALQHSDLAIGILCVILVFYIVFLWRSLTLLADIIDSTSEE